MKGMDQSNLCGNILQAILIVTINNGGYNFLIVTDGVSQ